MLEGNFKRYAFFILFSALLFQIVFSEGGVLGYIKLKRQIRSIDEKVKTLEEENVLLTKEIERFLKDDKYLEEYARKKFGLLREGERLYRVEK